MKRSVASQIEHWADIGRRAEALLSNAHLRELLSDGEENLELVSKRNNALVAKLIEEGVVSKGANILYKKDHASKSLPDIDAKALTE